MGDLLMLPPPTIISNQIMDPHIIIRLNADVSRPPQEGKAKNPSILTHGNQSFITSQSSDLIYHCRGIATYLLLDGAIVINTYLRSMTPGPISGPHHSAP